MTDAISSSGMAHENDVYVNGEVDDRRGRKLRDGGLFRIVGTNGQ